MQDTRLLYVPRNEVRVLTDPRCVDEQTHLWDRDRDESELVDQGFWR